jgi:ATP-binding cassette subfamily F protein 3
VDIERLERFVARFRYKKSKAKQAQAKLTQIARLEKERSRAGAELADLTRRRRTLGFEFLRPARTGRIVVEADHLGVDAGAKELMHDVTLVLERGEHVALVGPNGSGKTTLLEVLLGQRQAREGTIRLGHGVQPAYFSQHDIELDERGSVLQCAQSMTGLQRPQAQALLGRFLFSGWDEHEKPVTALSGGERRRLSLAVVVASGANLLLLDEPTNHLDLESREALEAALEAFPGTILLVSHDRALLDAVAERTIAVEDGELRSYDGGWADLLQARAEAAETAEAAVPAASAPPVRTKRAEKRPPDRAPSELEAIEAQIDELERRIDGLETSLAEDWSDQEALAAHRAARAQLHELLARWETLFEAAQSSTGH